MNIYGICNFIIIWMTTSLVCAWEKKTKAKKNKKKYLFKYFKALFVNQLRLILFTFILIIYYSLLIKSFLFFSRVSILQEIITSMEFELVTMQNKPRISPFV